jgi:hypothetical protein
MGRIVQTWELIGDSFAILKSDKELMLLPIFSGIFCVLVSVVILGGGALFLLPRSSPLAINGTNPHSMPQGFWVCLFVFYLANYFVIVFFNVALVSAASSRLAGGHATINDGLEAAWQRKGRILQWAFLSATVGILLRMIEERAAWLGRLVIGLVGMAWTLASYFVVPVLVAEDVGPGRGVATVSGFIPSNLGRGSGRRLQFRVNLHIVGVARCRVTVSGQEPGADRNDRRGSVGRSLLAHTLRRELRSTGNFCSCPLSLCQD